MEKSQVPSFQISDTLSLDWSKLRGPLIKLLRDSKFGIHLSNQKLILVPLWITHLSPRMQLPQPCEIFFQVLKAFGLHRGERVPYLNLISCFQRLSLLQENLQAKIVSIVSFLTLALWSPRPPFFLGLVRVSQLTICIFSFLQQIPYKIPLNFVYKIQDSTREAYELHDMSRDTSEGGLSKGDSDKEVHKLNFHPANLLFWLSIIKWKSLLQGWDWRIGKPRYFPQDCSW